jgi:hypothetical protein
MGVMQKPPQSDSDRSRVQLEQTDVLAWEMLVFILTFSML